MNNTFYFLSKIFFYSLNFQSSYRGFRGLCLLLLLPFFLSAEETMVVGQVLNKADNSPIAYVNIFFKNSTLGVQSNEEGYFMIKSNDRKSTLVFSAVGYVRREIHVKPGQSIGIQMELEEENTLLQEVFVIPGANPALELMKKVRLMRQRNDLTQQDGFSALSTEQNLVLLSKINQRNTNNRIFEQLKKGNISESDTSLVLPLYMKESKYTITAKDKKELSENIFLSPKIGVEIIEKLVGGLETELNFYNNTVSIFGKSLVSPIGNAGYTYYDYFLADSVQLEVGKQYEVHFRTKNDKNLAFNGKFRIDSATLSITELEAVLPNQSNINFVRNFKISEKFEKQTNNSWSLQSEKMTLNMSYALLADSIYTNPEIFISSNSIYKLNDSVSISTLNFAGSNYEVNSLDNKLEQLNNTPILRTAKWIADAMFTGYMKIGKVDIGKVEQIMRISDIEGFRLTLPLRTNELLWKNISLGGFVGYGFKDQQLKYSGIAQFKFPGEKRRILGVNFTNDYRRVDYNYNDFLFRENPLITGDADISSSVFALRSSAKLSERKEWLATFSNDWNSDIESTVYVRSNQLFANESMPMTLNGISQADYLNQQSVTVSTRFSFNERTFDDHLQRIYITNKFPVVYATVELGKSEIGTSSNSYAKLIGSVQQNIPFSLGKFQYIAEIGWILGNVPYPLLHIPPGSETGGYSVFQYNMMNYREYAADKYVNLHTELMLNGLIMNQIPIIKSLNLREICSFNLAYGSLSEEHKSQLDFPDNMYSLDKPYMEVGVGLTNILGIFTLQSVWRLTDLNHAGVSTWGLRGCLSLNF